MSRAEAWSCITAMYDHEKCKETYFFGIPVIDMDRLELLSVVSFLIKNDSYKEKLNKEQLRHAALAKLTPEERDALDLR